MLLQLRFPLFIFNSLCNFNLNIIGLVIEILNIGKADHQALLVARANTIAD